MTNVGPFVDVSCNKKTLCLSVASKSPQIKKNSTPRFLYVVGDGALQTPMVGVEERTGFDDEVNQPIITCTPVTYVQPQALSKKYKTTTT
jgi:hypothetical protein